jgi:hypothetical protein
MATVTFCHTVKMMKTNRSNYSLIYSCHNGCHKCIYELHCIKYWLQECYYIYVTNGVKDGLLSCQQKVLPMHQELTTIRNLNSNKNLSLYNMLFPNVYTILVYIFVSKNKLQCGKPLYTAKRDDPTYCLLHLGTVQQNNIQLHNMTNLLQKTHKLV